ncbi:MAG TPA: hypothetical protein VMI94_13260 [Bryobacteraceae bacterium]|nr:hypothetical protein [Bryobacteraceae bacterium]
MELNKILAELYEEKIRLDKVIASLEQLAEHSISIPVATSRRGRKFMSPQERQQVSERMRKYWADRKAADRATETRVFAAASAA